MSAPQPTQCISFDTLQTYFNTMPIQPPFHHLSPLERAYMIMKKMYHTTNRRIVHTGPYTNLFKILSDTARVDENYPEDKKIMHESVQVRITVQLFVDGFNIYYGKSDKSNTVNIDTSQVFGQSVKKVTNYTICIDDTIDYAMYID